MTHINYFLFKMFQKKKKLRTSTREMRSPIDAQLIFICFHFLLIFILCMYFSHEFYLLFHLNTVFFCVQNIRRTACNSFVLYLWKFLLYIRTCVCESRFYYFIKVYYRHTPTCLFSSYNIPTSYLFLGTFIYSFHFLVVIWRKKFNEFF